MIRSVLSVIRRFWKFSMSTFRMLWKDRLGRVGTVVLTAFILLAAFAPYIAPYNPELILRTDDGRIKNIYPPSIENLLGTNQVGKDIFSQLVYGSRSALFIGILAAIVVSFIGLNIGLISAYYGGRVDKLLMTVVDITYGVPFLPFVVILVVLLGGSLWNIILALAVLGWRTTARVVRSQVLSLKERPFVEAAKVVGASNARIMYMHIAPNVIPLALLYGIVSIGWAILTESSISFLGFGDPRIVTWGVMLEEAFTSQAIMRGIYWWILPPGMCIALLVISCYFIQKGLEELINPKLRKY